MFVQKRIIRFLCIVIVCIELTKIIRLQLVSAVKFNPQLTIDHVFDIKIIYYSNHIIIIIIVGEETIFVLVVITFIYYFALEKMNILFKI